MKKVLSLVALAGMAMFVACGPSAEEIAAKEKAKADSIAAEQVKADSIAAEQAKADSIAIVEQAKADSIAAAATPKKK